MVKSWLFLHLPRCTAPSDLTKYMRAGNQIPLGATRGGAREGTEEECLNQISEASGQSKKEWPEEVCWRGSYAWFLEGAVEAPELPLDPQQELCHELWAAVTPTTEIASAEYGWVVWTLRHCSREKCYRGCPETPEAAAGSQHHSREKQVCSLGLDKWCSVGPHWNTAHAPRRTQLEGTTEMPAGGPRGFHARSSPRFPFMICPDICT